MKSGLDGQLMSGTKNILVIMPCYNEQGRIGAVVRSIQAVLPEAGVVVIDDSSSDSSISEAAAAGATVLPHVCNLGYGAALETGYLYAERNNADIVLQMDGDGQHLADQLPVILKDVSNGTADLVIGSRYLGGQSKEMTSWVRRLGHRVFAGIIFVLCGRKLKDPTSGFQALNRRALNLFSSGVFPCDYPDSDVILMAHMAGIRITEVPVVMKPRTGGTSMHSGLKPVYYGMKMLLSIFVVLLNHSTWHKWRSENPCDRQTEPERK